ncbi:MAG TPA: hypothetical protein ENJ50_02025 [Planctomycetaceae bacterium]|nr:hypothetical protein [Planctomycetaceae bacterium]
MSNLTDDPEPLLWELARNVTGWGRIHVVERLAGTQHPEIKDWLLREGYRNSVMYEYLAYTCATSGGLLEALSQETVDRDLLTSAGEILAALIAGGPAQDIDDYDEGAVAVEMFLNHMESSAQTLDDFLHVQTLKQFLDDEDADWESRAERGWTDTRRNHLRAMCARILSRPGWSDLARDGLTSEDEAEFDQASRVADALGLDTWEAHWRRLREKPTDSGRWYHVMARCDDDRIVEVLRFAEENIDLEKIAGGPAEELGLGPGWEHHRCLDFILQELKRFVGQGSRLIQAGLQSPVVRNRNLAVAALSAWGQEQWGDALRSALEAASACEPRDNVRERMEKVLKGIPLED